MSKLFIFSIVAGVVGAIIADRKGRRWPLWFVLCTFIPLLIIVVLILPAKVAKGRTKRCPFCGEVIRQEASVCRYCGKELPIELVQCRYCGKYVPEGDYCIECKRSLRG